MKLLLPLFSILVVSTAQAAMPIPMNHDGRELSASEIQTELMRRQEESSDDEARVVQVQAGCFGPGFCPGPGFAPMGPPTSPYFRGPGGPGGPVPPYYGPGYVPGYIPPPVAVLPPPPVFFPPPAVVGVPVAPRVIYQQQAPAYVQQNVQVRRYGDTCSDGQRAVRLVDSLPLGMECPIQLPGYNSTGRVVEGN